MIIIYFLVNCLLTHLAIGQIHWNGNWALACDFRGNDLSNVQISGELCGQKCSETNECTHFTWTRFNGGTCWLKSGSVSKNDAFPTQDQTMVCGVMYADTTTNRPSGTSKTVKFTYYWISSEEDFPLGSDHALRDCNGGTLAYISKTYWESLKLECSGRLRTGEFVNGGNSDCTCFMKVAAPLGSKGNHLQQYVSIAANDIPYGTKVYVRQLDGIELPNKLKHNGCVRVDDVSWSFGGNHIDFYVLEKSMYEKLSPFVDGHVDIVTDTNCNIQSY